MKKLFFTTVAFFVLTITYGQTAILDTTKKEFKNVIGVDVTALLRQFFNEGSTTNFYYNYPIVISYRRIFHSNNALRLGIGGYVDAQNGFTNDTIGGNGNRYAFNIRGGYEHYCYLGKRFMYYFGADMIGGYSYVNSEHHWSTTTSSTQTTTISSCGLAPLLGIVFKINDCMSVSTEANYAIVYSHMKDVRLTVPQSNYNTRSTNNRTTSEFSGPGFIQLRIKF